MNTTEKKVVEIEVKTTGEADLKSLARQLASMRKDFSATRASVKDMNREFSAFAGGLKALGGAFGIGLSIKALVKDSEAVQDITKNVRELGAAFVDTAFAAAGFTDALGDETTWSNIKGFVTDVADALGSLIKTLNDWTGGTAAKQGIASIFGTLHGMYTERFGMRVQGPPKVDLTDTKFSSELDEATKADLARTAALMSQQRDNQRRFNEAVAEYRRDQQMAADVIRRRNQYDPNRTSVAPPQREADLNNLLDLTAEIADQSKEIEASMAGIAKETASAVMDTRQWGDAWATASREANDIYKQFTDEAADRTGILLDAAAVLQHSLVGVFTGGIRSARDFFRTVLQGLAQIAAQQAAMKITSGVLGFLGGLAGGVASGAGGGGDGGLAAAIAAGVSAKGNVFAGGNVVPMARGDIVSRPTLFPMARGMGLMGEAGPEAVMPLRRGRDGKLGVSAASPKVVIENHGAPVSAAVLTKDDEMRIVLRSAQMGAQMGVAEVNRSVSSGYGSTAQNMSRSYGLRRRP